jgi:hypothetical protein
MTLSTTLTRESYPGIGVITPLQVPFAFLGPDELLVIERDNTTGALTTKTLNTDYAVAGGLGETGTVTPTVAIAVGKTWIILRATKRLQPTDYEEGDEFPSALAELGYDRGMMIAQELEDRINRSLRFPLADTEVIPELPSFSSRANKLLGFNGVGDPTLVAAPEDLSPITAEGSTTARGLAERFGEVANVKDFGARGDGVTDDLLAIRAAYAAAGTRRVPVVWPAGDFIVSDTIDLANDGTDENYYGSITLGAGYNAGPTFRKNATRIVMTGNNKPIFRLWGPTIMRDLCLVYQTQQTTAQTASIALQVNDVSAGDIRNIRIWQAHISIGQAQAGFIDTANAFWDCILGNIASYKASHTHFDLRNYQGGGTNMQLEKLYINGGGSLDFATQGQTCLYGIRGAAWSGFALNELSIDGLTFTEKLLEVENANLSIATIRFESVECQKNNDGWIKFTGGQCSVRIGTIELYRCRALVANVTTATYIVYPNAVLSHVDIGNIIMSSNCAFPASTVNRLLTIGATDANSQVRLGPCNIAAANISQDVWTETHNGFPIVKEFMGRFIARWLKLGSINSKEWVGNAIPTAGAHVLGDRMIIAQPGDFGRPLGYTIGSAGTPGTWAPYAWVGGQFTYTTNGDANLSYTAKVSRGYYLFGTTLTAARTITLNTAGATNGDIAVFQRSAAGAFPVNVGAGTPLCQLLAFEWCMVQFNGGAWGVMAKGSVADGGSSVVAHKNGTDQTGVVTNTATKVTFATEDSDPQSLWDATNSRLVALVAARYRLSATVHFAAANVVDQTQYSLLLYKNGALYRTLDCRQASGTGAFSLTGSATFFADTTTPDVFEVYVRGGAAAEGDKTIEGDADKTYVCIEKLA